MTSSFPDASIHADGVRISLLRLNGRHPTVAGMSPESERDRRTVGRASQLSWLFGLVLARRHLIGRVVDGRN
jgi:hypothetical protein